ncbi:MAG TPA: AI-2E family transporter [Methylophilaceae bacterium]|nr:AI-2E family transporter [Methylophilaceae bacterium]
MSAQQDISQEKLTPRNLLDVLIRAGMVAVLVVLCFQIFAPFLNMMLWALILAVALYPLHRMIAARIGGRQGVAATLLVLVGLVLIVAPAILLTSSMAEWVKGLVEGVRQNGIVIPPPTEAVAAWPLVGGKIYGLWQQAATDLPGLLQTLHLNYGVLAKSALGFAAGMGGSMLVFIFSLIVAGIIMAYGESGSKAAVDIANRFVGKKKGPALAALSTATIRSVAQGVIGVAFIQALLVGIGLVWAGIPAAGLLAIILLVLGIAQLPALIITLPAIAYIWMVGGHSSLMAVLMTVYLIAAGMADGFLKPVLLGRGVDAPMPVILLGALGGMVWAGIIGMFVGAVFLALGYQIFMAWVHEGEEVNAASK